MVSEFTPAGHAIRAQALCVEPTSLGASILDFFDGMIVPNSPVWKASVDEDWMAILLVTGHTGYSSELSGLIKGGEYVRPGMVVDEKDKIFGGKKVVSVVPYGALSGSSILGVSVVFLRPGITQSQLNEAEDLNRSTGYWMNFHAGKMSSYTRGTPSTDLGTFGRQGYSAPWVFSDDREATNAGLIPDLTSVSTITGTPSSVGDNPSTLSMNDYRSKAVTYSDYTAAPTAFANDGPVDIFGSDHTNNYQTRTSTTWAEFTVPEGDGKYTLNVEKMVGVVTGPWRRDGGSYPYYNSSTWYSYWKDVGWALYEMSGSIYLFDTMKVDSTVFRSDKDSVYYQFSVPAVNDIPLKAGATYRFRYIASYAQTAGLGDSLGNMGFYVSDFTINFSDGKSFTGNNRPDLRVSLQGQDKWSDKIIPSGDNYRNYNTNEF